MIMAEQVDNDKTVPLELPDPLLREPDIRQTNHTGRKVPATRPTEGKDKVSKEVIFFLFKARFFNKEKA